MRNMNIHTLTGLNNGLLTKEQYKDLLENRCIKDLELVSTNEYGCKEYIVTLTNGNWFRIDVK